jgi:hypothetical protein
MLRDNGMKGEADNRNILLSSLPRPRAADEIALSRLLA